MEFSKTLLQYAPWSMSKVETAAQCGLRFHWKYVDNVKEDRQAVRPEQRVGTAAHKAIELVLKGRDLKAAFTVAAVDEKLTTKEIEDLMTFQGGIKGFVERIDKFKAKNPVQTQIIEHKFGLTVDLTPTTFFAKDVFFRGVWDFGLHLKSQDLIIIDHKSGQPADDVTKYTNQLNSYALAGRKLFPDVKGAQSAIHYLKNGALVWGTYIKASEIDDRLMKWFMEYMDTCTRSLDRTPREGWFCDYCGYAGKCPLKKARVVP